MKQSGHLNPIEETGTGCPSLQSMEGRLQTSMEVWVDINNLICDLYTITKGFRIYCLNHK